MRVQGPGTKEIQAILLIESFKLNRNGVHIKFLLANLLSKIGYHHSSVVGRKIGLPSK
jgi:hypothetical protein